MSIFEEVIDVFDYCINGTIELLTDGFMEILLGEDNYKNSFEKMNEAIEIVENSKLIFNNKLESLKTKYIDTSSKIIDHNIYMDINRKIYKSVIDKDFIKSLDNSKNSFKAITDYYNKIITCEKNIDIILKTFKEIHPIHRISGFTYREARKELANRNISEAKIFKLKVEREIEELDIVERFITLVEDIIEGERQIMDIYDNEPNLHKESNFSNQLIKVFKYPYRQQELIRKHAKLLNEIENLSKN